MKIDIRWLTIPWVGVSLKYHKELLLIKFYILKIFVYHVFCSVVYVRFSKHSNLSGTKSLMKSINNTCIGRVISGLNSLLDGLMSAFTFIENMRFQSHTMFFSTNYITFCLCPMSLTMNKVKQCMTYNLTNHNMRDISFYFVRLGLSVLRADHLTWGEGAMFSTESEMLFHA